MLKGVIESTRRCLQQAICRFSPPLPPPRVPPLEAAKARCLNALRAREEPPAHQFAAAAAAPVRASEQPDPRVTADTGPVRCGGEGVSAASLERTSAQEPDRRAGRSDRYLHHPESVFSRKGGPEACFGTPSGRNDGSKENRGYEGSYLY